MQIDAGLKDWVIPIAVAIIAVIGTLAGALLAHRRWKVERRSKYDEERREVYRNVWEQAEALNLQHRTGELSDESYRPALTALNAAMLKASPHLDEADRVLIRDYVDAMEAFLLLVAHSGDVEARDEVATTGILHTAVVRGLVEAQQHALDLRERVVERMRAVLQEV